MQTIELNGKASDWLPKAIKDMQTGNVEANSKLPEFAPLRDEIVDMTRIIGSKRRLEEKPDSLEKRVLLYTAEEGNRVFANKPDSSPLIEASKDANKGILSDVIARIAYNHDLAGHAQTLLCAATKNESERLAGYADKLEEYTKRRELYDELRGSIFDAVNNLAGSKYVLGTIREESDHATLQRVDSSLEKTMIDLIELSSDVAKVEYESGSLKASSVELMFRIADLRGKSREMEQASLDLAI